jgi:hypothetical protein
MLVVTALSGLAAFGVALTTVRRTAPITVDQAKVMWAMHRKASRCGGHKWEPIKRKQDKVVGFRCQCGYQYTQKRPLVCGSLKQDAEHSERPTSLLFFSP